MIGTAFRQKTLSIAEAVAWYLERIQKYNHAGPNLNAVRLIRPDAIADARESDEALANGRDRGPLHGVPYLLKDSILTTDGMTATAGVSALSAFLPRVEATLVRKLREAGAILLGKANMTEFADYVADDMPAEFSSLGGVVKNPHGIRYGRGQGSSVGSAAAVAAGFCMFAIGGETQNSIQTPASYSSVTGYKPTVGYIGRYGIMPLVPNQDSPGPITRTMADAMLVLDAIAGPDARDPLSLLAERRPLNSAHLDSVTGIRIGVMRKGQADRPEFSDVMTLFDETLRNLSRAGAVIVDPCDLPAAEQLQEVRSCVFRTEFKASLNAFLEDHNAPCGMRSLSDIIHWNENHPHKIPYGQSLLLAAEETCLDEQYVADRARDIALSRTGGIDAAMGLGSADVLIAPMGAPAKCTGKAGSPVAAIPIGITAEGVPFGITLVSKVGDDRKLLAIASAVERAVGNRRLPEL
jgi:amidase